jgi:hypothetical protein
MELESIIKTIKSKKYRGLGEASWVTPPIGA